MNNKYIILLVLLGINIYTLENVVMDNGGPKDKPTIMHNSQSATQQSPPAIPITPITQNSVQTDTEKQITWQKDIEQHHNHACIRRINKLYTQVK